MLLRSVEVQNFRSLENVSLQGLTEFNVLIGRNNAGKSSVGAAVSFVASRVFGRGRLTAPDREVLTNHDPLRKLEVDLTLEPDGTHRGEFIDLAIAAGHSGDRRQILLDSPLLRQISYRFRAEPGAPETIELGDVRIMAENGRWATIYDKDPPPKGGTGPRIAHLSTIASSSPDDPLSADRLDLSQVRNLFGHGIPDLTEPTGTAFRRGIDTWIFGRVIDYFSTLFFFDPFRHAAEVLPAEMKDRLSPNGSDLAVVLNSLSSGGRRKFLEIERFVHQAIPDIGILQPGFLRVDGGAAGTQQVRISFEQPNGESILLHDMGGGVEELLMVATVIATEGRSATLFLEEPETHLHPGAQRYLAERLRTSVNQAFIATHSPTFVNGPSPRSIYRVSISAGRTSVVHVGNPEGLALALEEIDARNSDVLLSDAVLLVEGPADREVILAWSRILGLNFDEQYLTVLPMGGGAHAERHAPLRSDVLTGISQRAGIPHLFVLDRDERSQGEIASLERQLGEKLHIMSKRELENYLLAPDAIREALLEKYADNGPVREQIEATESEAIAEAIKLAAEGFFDLVLMKRIRAEIGGLKDGFLPAHELLRLVGRAREVDLPQVVLESVRSVAAERIDGLDIPELVLKERESLEREWADPAVHLVLAPGEEILGRVFAQFGGEFTKRTDSVRIARAMSEAEIDEEIQTIVGKAVGLVAAA